jgi:hypothetical protein
MSKREGILRAWGSTERERAAPFPIDGFVDGGRVVWRAVTIRQPPERIWSWLGQLRLAPYSYDWLDNGLHRSPRHLVPGLAPIAPGDPFMVWPRVVAVEPLQTITFLCRGYHELDTRYGGRNWFANLAQKPGYRLFNLDWVGGSYRLDPVSSTETRLIAKLRWQCRANRFRRLGTVLFQLADFVMMRRQLLNLKALAESS